MQTAGGNHIVVRIGKGRWAFYAHMQPGSMRVRKGDRVRQGQVLGLLGNTGNTDGPHLHFHIMDGPSPLQSNGLPFVYSRFTGQGLITDEAARFERPGHTDRCQGLAGSSEPACRWQPGGRLRALTDHRQWPASATPRVQ